MSLSMSMPLSMMPARNTPPQARWHGLRVGRHHWMSLIVVNKTGQRSELDCPPGVAAMPWNGVAWLGQCHWHSPCDDIDDLFIILIKLTLTMTLTLWILFFVFFYQCYGVVHGRSESARGDSEWYYQCHCHCCRYECWRNYIISDELLLY